MPFVRARTKPLSWTDWFECKCCEPRDDTQYNDQVKGWSFLAFVCGMLLHPAMRYWGLSLIERVYRYLLIMVPGSILLYISWKQKKVGKMDDVPGFWGLILFNCGAASLVVGIMMDAFCVPLFGTTECEYNKMPSNLQTYVLFLVVVLCSVIWLYLVEACYSCCM